MDGKGSEMNKCSIKPGVSGILADLLQGIMSYSGCLVGSEFMVHFFLLLMCSVSIKQPDLKRGSDSQMTSSLLLLCAMSETSGEAFITANVSLLEC